MPRFIELKRRGSDTLLINKSRIDTIEIVNGGPAIEVTVNGINYEIVFETVNKMNKWIDEVYRD